MNAGAAALEARGLRALLGSKQVAWRCPKGGTRSSRATWSRLLRPCAA